MNGYVIDTKNSIFCDVIGIKKIPEMLTTQDIMNFSNSIKNNKERVTYGLIYQRKSGMTSLTTFKTREDRDNEFEYCKELIFAQAGIEIEESDNYEE